MQKLQQSASQAAVNFCALSVKQELIKVLAHEAESLQNLITHLPDNIDLLVQKILTTSGKIIFSGVGKSGLVARKLAATFSSLGISSCFLHPGDALHGDLGMVQPHDLFITLSKSGTGIEFDHIFPFLKSQKNCIILMCCAQGILAQKADLTICLPLNDEACSLNLAPTSSTTLMMAFGDAVAVVVSKLRDFDKKDFARFHPAGILGKKLLLTVQDLMYSGSALPFIQAEDSFQDLLVAITAKKLGIGIVVDAGHKLLGLITDGDLRRACKNGPQVFDHVARTIMTPAPKSIAPHTLAIDALAYMKEFSITSLIVTDQEKVIGIIHLHDIIKTGLQG